MKAKGFVRTLFSALCFVGAAGCSSNGGGTDTDAGVRDAGADAGDVPLFIGPGNLAVTWTIDGMPPSVGCAAVGAAFVDVQASFGNPTRVPCEQGSFSKASVMAGQLSVGTTLLRADGTAIYCYAIPTTVQSGETTNASIDFVAPGTLRVTWTVNGDPARTACAGTTAANVAIRVGNLPRLGTSCTAGGITFSGRAEAGAVCTPTMQGIQPGSYPVTADIYNAMGDRISTVTGTADVPSGAAGSLALAFENIPPHAQ